MPVVKHRVDQQLECQVGAVVVAVVKRQASRQSATGAAPANGDAAPVDAELGSVVHHPVERCESYPR